MKADREHDFGSEPHRLLRTVLLFGFGIAVLAFLMAIEHQTWFHIKPATGTALAMSYTSDKSAADRPAPAARP